MKIDHLLYALMGLYIALTACAVTLAIFDFGAGEILSGLVWTAAAVFFGGVLAYIAR